jgi:hypothetical protein
MDFGPLLIALIEMGSSKCGSHGLRHRCRPTWHKGAPQFATSEEPEDGKVEAPHSVSANLSQAADTALQIYDYKLAVAHVDEETGFGFDHFRLAMAYLA